MRKTSGPGPGNKSHGARTLCVFACLCMCVAVMAHWYKCLCASAGSLHQTWTEWEKKTVTSEGLFKNLHHLRVNRPLEVTVHVAHSAASASTDLFLELPLTPQHYLSVQPGLLFSFSCIPVFHLCCLCIIGRLGFIIETRGVVSNSLLMCTSHMMLDLVARGHKLFVFQSGWSDAHQWVTLSLWKQHSNQSFWTTVHQSSTS